MHHRPNAHATISGNSSRRNSERGDVSPTTSESALLLRAIKKSERYSAIVYLLDEYGDHAPHSGHFRDEDFFTLYEETE
jgi:hypothetical protein